MRIDYRYARLAAGLRVCWARLAGFEPATRCLEGSCSIRLSYRRLPNVLCSIQVTQRPHRLDNGHDRDLSGVRAVSRAAVLQGRAVMEPGSWATAILLYLAVMFAGQRMVVIVRSQRVSISGQNQVTGLT